MPATPTSRRQPAAAPTAAPDLLLLLGQQVGWLIDGGQAARRVFTRWLLEASEHPANLTPLLLHARRLTGPHLVQLEQLGSDLATATSVGENGPLFDALLATTGAPTASLFARVARCFSTACGSAAQIALAARRVDLAAVLASWSAAWRELEQQTASPGARASGAVAVDCQER